MAAFYMISFFQGVFVSSEVDGDPFPKKITPKSLVKF